jgi:hypothetical protein
MARLDIMSLPFVTTHSTPSFVTTSSSMFLMIG